MKNSLNLNLSQRTIITQDLRNSIELLQLSTLELMEKIQSEILENPFLEEAGNNEELFLVREKLKSEISQNYENFSESKFPDSHQKYLESSPDLESFSEYLLAQLRLIHMTEEEYGMCDYIISLLDEKGFLKDSPEIIAKELNIAVEKVYKVLNFIHILEPPGLAAKNIQESLFIQAKIKYPEKYDLHNLLDDYFNLLEKQEYRTIQRKMNISKERMVELAEMIRHLEPFPASSFQKSRPDYIIPDAKIFKSQENYEIQINDEIIPKLNINSFYKNIDQKSMNEKDRDYFKTKLYSAQWLIKSIEQRKNTLLKVISSIIELQSDFFNLGPESLKPMTLRDVADMIQMHESTVSRITTNKYIETKWGIVELKWFFSSGVKGAEGSKQSSKKVQEIIKNLVKEEDAKNPLSDNEIVELIQKDGIEIARRTVAKYRKILKILPSNFRKKGI